MDASISTFCRSLAAFCNHIESSSRALSDSLQKKPIPLDSAAAAFLQSLERRISTTSTDLNLLHSMAFDTISFEELLGYCNEVYKANAKKIFEVEDLMTSFGYVPDVGMEHGEYEDFGTDLVLSSTSKAFDGTSSTMNNEFSASLKMASQGITSYDDFQPSKKSLVSGFAADSMDSTAGPSMKAEIMISEDDYDKLPAFMKKLSSWEELQDAVDKFNCYLSENNGPDENGKIDQDVLEKLGLGRKGRSYLLLLLRMGKLSAETLINDSIVYHVRRSK